MAAPDTRGEPLFVDLQEEIEPVSNAGQVSARQIEAIAPQGAARQHHSVMSGQQIAQRDVFADIHAAADLDPTASDLLDFAVDDVAWQAESGDALIQHAARPDVLFQHDDRMAATRQFPGHRQTGHAGADHRHALARRLVEQRGQSDGVAGKEIGGCTLAEADGQRLALLPPPVPAGRFAGPRTDAPQDGRKDVVLQIDPVGRIEVPAGNRRQVFRDPRMGRAGGLAGDDELDPLHVARWCVRLPSGAEIRFGPDPARLLQQNLLWCSRLGCILCRRDARTTSGTRLRQIAFQLQRQGSGRTRFHTLPRGPLQGRRQGIVHRGGNPDIVSAAHEGQP